MQYGQLLIPAWGKFCSLDEHGLQVLVPLLGNWSPLFLAGRFPLCAAQAAVADCLANRCNSFGVADLQYPGQRREFAYPRDGHETLHPIMDKVVGVQRLYKPLLKSAKHLIA